MLDLAPETETLARLLAAKTGTTPEAVVHDAVAAKARDAGVAALAPLEKKKATLDEIMAIARHCAALPILDHRSADEILGYDDNGLPT
jgi:antitoxin VapB